MPTMTKIGTFRDVIPGTTYVPSVRDFAHDFPDPTGTITQTQRNDVYDLYVARLHDTLRAYGVMLYGGDLYAPQGVADQETLTLIRTDMADNLDLYEIIGLVCA